MSSTDGLWNRAVVADLHGFSVRIASLPDLIAMKEAAARSEDEAHLAELRTLFVEREKDGGQVY